MSNLGNSNFGISNATAGGLVDFTFWAVVASAMMWVLVLFARGLFEVGICRSASPPCARSITLFRESPEAERRTFRCRVFLNKHVAKTLVHCNRNYCNAQFISRILKLLRFHRDAAPAAASGPRFASIHHHFGRTLSKLLDLARKRLHLMAEIVGLQPHDFGRVLRLHEPFGELERRRH